MNDSPQDDFQPKWFANEDNPFRDNPDAASAQPTPAEPPTGRGKVHHVRVVAVLMIIQGVLEMVAGLMLLAFGIGMPMFMNWQATHAPHQTAMPPTTMPWLVVIIYCVIGILSLTSAGMLIFAGIRNYQFRNWTFGVVALCSSLVTLLSCYCAPTAFGLLIYGLIVYLDPMVGQAFATRRVEEGP